VTLDGRALWPVTICLVLVAGCGGQKASHTRTTTAAVTPQRQIKPARPHPHPHPVHRHRPPVGSRPQTHQLPSASTPAFRQEMRALWRGVKHNSLSAALPAFFPEPAYLQVKAIADPAADWRSRLVGGLRLDLAAAHKLLAGSVAQSHLVGVSVPAGFAHWVTPGTCENRVGYWEVPNARVLYRLRGTLRSFGIASMISWRGIWYVVHLGAVQRSGSGGMVDDPSLGRGVSVNSGTC